LVCATKGPVPGDRDPTHSRLSDLGDTHVAPAGSEVALDIELPERGVGAALADALRAAGQRLLALRAPPDR
jgi:hypothetical protein